MAASWNPLVVLVECSVNLGSGKVSETASRVRDLLLLATQREANQQDPAATPRTAAAAADNSLYVIVKREDLEAKGGKDPKSLAATLRQRIKQDRIKGLARQQKNGDKDPKGSSAAKASAEIAASSSSDFASSFLSGGETTRAAIEQELETDDTIRIEPCEADLEAARSVLGISDEEASPDKIYLLTDYPSTAEEASFLISSAAGEQVLDAVLELRGPAQEPPYTAPSRTASRADSVSGAQSVGFPRSDTLESLAAPGADLKASAASLPTLSLQALSQTASRASLASGSEAGLVPSDSKSTLGEARSIMADALAAPYDGSGPTLSSEVVHALRKARAEAKGPGWQDIVFLELDVAPRDPSKSLDLAAYRPLALLASFAQLTQSLAAEKFRFLAYVKLCEHVKIPRGAKPAKEGDAVLASYRALSAAQPMHSVAGVLYALVGAVSGEDVLPERSLTPVPVCADSRRAEYVNLGDRCALQLATSNSPLLDDQLELEHARWKLVPTPGAKGRQRMPRRPVLDDQARQLLNTQYSTLLPLDADREQLVRTIQRFEQMLTDADPPSGVRTEWDFSQWTCLREMDETRAPQQLGLALSEEPLALTHYMARYDTMLVALHRRTPPGRHCTVKRSAFAHTNLRPTFSEWPHLDLRQRPCIYDVDADPLRALEQVAEVFFPCDGSIVRMESLPASKGRSWLSVDRDGHRFGLRQPLGASLPAFFASFEEGSVLEVQRGPAWPNKPDGLDTMVSAYTCANGLHLQHCSNGEIRMSSPGWASRETSRVVRDQGTVISFLASGLTRVLFASGDIILQRSMGPKKDPEVLRIPVHDGGRASTRVDYESGAIVVQRLQRPEEGDDPKAVEIKLIRHKDGSRLVCHADGTRILTGADGVVRVEAPDLATVKIQAAVEATSYGHSVGGRVDISRGGHVVRSSTLAPDATVVQVEYDTRVTAKINGHLRILKPDGTMVHATDEGKVLWKSWDAASREARARRPDEEEKDDSIGCFLFNCDDGSLRMQDEERNVFAFSDVTDAAKASSEVTLSGSFGPVEAVVNHALRPRLFVLDGSGGGYELLHASDVARERQRVERANRAKFAPSASVDGNVAGPEICTLESVELELSSGPDRLCVANSLLPRIVHVDEQVARFERARAQIDGGEDRLVEARPVRVLVDSVQRLATIADEERRHVVLADAAFGEWRAQVDLLENRFNVDDLRSEDAKAEERKMQALIAKERKRLAKAAAKKRAAADGSFKSKASSASGSKQPQAQHEEHEHEVAAPVTLLGATSEQEGFGDDLADSVSVGGYGDGTDGVEDEEGKDDETLESPSRKPRPAPRGAPLTQGLRYSYSGLTES